jgi:hypothetical protein
MIPTALSFQTHPAIPKYGLMLKLHCFECGKFIKNLKQTDDIKEYFNHEVAPIPYKFHAES